MSTFHQFPRCCCAVIYYKGLVLTYSSSYVFSTHILGYWRQHQPSEGGYLSGESGIGRSRRRTPPPPYWWKYCIFMHPPLLVKILHFHAFFWEKVKLTSLFQPKCGLRPHLLHILDSPLYLLGIPLITLLPQYLVERTKLQLCSIVKH